jgi:hypothetical protein
MIAARCGGVVWCGVAPYGVGHGVARRGERDCEMERNCSGVCVWYAWLCLAAAGAEAYIGGMC